MTKHYRFKRYLQAEEAAALPKLRSLKGQVFTIC